MAAANGLTVSNRTSFWSLTASTFSVFTRSSLTCSRSAHHTEICQDSAARRARLSWTTNQNKDRSCEVVVFTHPVQCLLHQINAGHWKWCTDKRPTRHLLVILTVWPVLSQLHHEPSRNSSQRHRCHHTTHLLSLKPAQPSQPYGSTSQDKKPPRESLCLCCFVGNHWPMRLYGIVCMKRSSVVAKDPDWGANCRMICKCCS